MPALKLAGFSKFSAAQITRGDKHSTSPLLPNRFR
jgi:hypothetical protein